MKFMLVQCTDDREMVTKEIHNRPVNMDKGNHLYSVLQMWKQRHRQFKLMFPRI